MVQALEEHEARVRAQEAARAAAETRERAARDAREAAHQGWLCTLAPTVRERLVSLRSDLERAENELHIADEGMKYAEWKTLFEWSRTTGRRLQYAVHEAREAYNSAVAEARRPAGVPVPVQPPGRRGYAPLQFTKRPK